MVDVGEMMGLKKAAEAVGATTDKADEKGEKKTKKRPAKTPPTQEDIAVQEKLREERRLKLKKDEDRLRELDRKDKEKRKKRSRKRSERRKSASGWKRKREQKRLQSVKGNARSWRRSAPGCRRMPASHGGSPRRL
eukprot:SRR837773.2260.p1 GENE.SRR837773.2260~~SRR837773.2260.p1  ORF type:complete len:136 (-),score=10.88 SRR837773.2260:327-734(-)